MLSCKMQELGKTLIATDKRYPSSKTCSYCVAVNSGLTLNERTWICSCGKTVDRDYNEAINIRSEGLRMLA